MEKLSNKLSRVAQELRQSCFADVNGFCFLILIMGYRDVYSFFPSYSVMAKRISSNSGLKWGLGIEHEFLVEEDGVIQDSSSLIGMIPTPLACSSEDDGTFVYTIKRPNPEQSKKPRLNKYAAEGVRRFIYDQCSLSHSLPYSSVDDLVASMRRNKTDSSVIPGPLRRLFAGDKLVAKLYRYYYDGRYNSYWGGTLIVREPPRLRASSTPLSQSEVIDSLVGYFTSMRLYQKKKAKEKHARSNAKHIELDGSFFEVKSTRPHMATVSSVVRQVRTAESRALTSLVATPKTEDSARKLRPFGYSGFIDKETGKPRYAGSYHIWLTMPHSLAISKNRPTAMTTRRLVLARHALLGHLMQWIEPLIMATYASGDPRALGAGKRNAFRRASMRADLNTYGGYGTSSMHMISPGLGHDVYTVTYYNTAKDAIEGRDMRVSRPGDNRVLTVLSEGSDIPFESCMDIDRIPNWLVYHQLEQLKHPVDVELTKPPVGADVRTEGLCSAMKLPTIGGWRPVWVKIGSGSAGGRLRLRLHYISKDSKLTDSIPLNAKSWQDRTGTFRGIEFRAIDNFPSEGIESLARIVVLVAAAADAQVRQSGFDGVTKRLTQEQAAGSPAYSDALYAAANGGCHAILSSSYLKALYSEMGVSARGLEAGSTAFRTLCHLAEALHKVHGGGELVQLMDPGRTGPPIPYNANQMGWEAAFEALSPRPSASNILRNARWEMDRPFFLERQRIVT